ncbi:MAG: excinuclease ABC subunit UvrC [Alphaproteobacteria bacterium]|jgi:excinuclease ABC subunit C|nr:excinuclease ABC subunit UvrC [Alphaproteobacteria bacterium]
MTPAETGGTHASPDTSNSHSAEDPVPQGATNPPSLAAGIAVIKGHLRTLPGSPGVYRMHDAKGNPLYIGKAKNLKKRVAAYTRPNRMDGRLQRMVAATTSMEFITTHTEVEALLLESNLIKKLKPRYNILLRDDKSFPYILITGEHDWPQITKHRGARNRAGRYFGPFASAGAVNATINALQKAFPLRNCSDSIFSSRTRPCLQYQIKRCTAPCVGKIDAKDYGVIVDQAFTFLSGKSHGIQESFSTRMQAASSDLDFETAAIYRDRIHALTQIQARQGINNPGIGDADVVAVHQKANQTCVQVFFFRAGQNFGNRAHFPSNAADHGPAEVAEAFLGQFYAGNPPPKQILLSHPIEHHALVEEALSQRAERKVTLLTPKRGKKHDLVVRAGANAAQALDRRLAESASQRRLLEGVADAFGMDSAPQRIEVYDNSHISGSDAVGSMIVAGPEGMARNQYRKFNIKNPDLAPGDDFAMVREVLTRRFARLLKEDAPRESGNWPDLVLIDGGAGQLSSAQSVFTDLGITGVMLGAISKGPDRNAGREQFHFPDKAPFRLPDGDSVLYFLQRLRDEAHRFAIEAHRGRRSRRIKGSPLDGVPGIGAARKRALLHHFGSARAVTEAGIADLESVDGISHTVAGAIYNHFHD